MKLAMLCIQGKLTWKTFENEKIIIILFDKFIDLLKDTQYKQNLTQCTNEIPDIPKHTCISEFDFS